MNPDINASIFQQKLQEAIKNVPPLLRQKIYADIEAEIKKQRALDLDHHALNLAISNDSKAACEFHYQVFRECCKATNEPEKFHVAWLQMICCGIMIYEDMMETLQAVTDATAAPDGSLIITDKTKQQ